MSEPTAVAEAPPAPLAPGLQPRPRPARRSRRGLLHRTRPRQLFLTLGATLSAALIALLAAAALGSWQTTLTKNQEVNFGSAVFTPTDPSEEATTSLTTQFGPAVAGDSGYRILGVSNDGKYTLQDLVVTTSLGSVSNTYQTAPSGVTFASALNTQVDYCDGTWGGALSPSTCTGGSGWVDASATASTTVAAMTGSLALDQVGDLTPGNRLAFRIRIELSSSAAATLMGTSMPITWTFSGDTSSAGGNQ